jgi:aspartate/methionine/tyrosine aminotransferase
MSAEHMNADLLLARGVPDSKNLTLGDAVVVRRRLEGLLTMVRGPQYYPTLAGEPGLRQAIQPFLSCYLPGKAKTWPANHVVVTCGAKQGLLACLWALQEERRRQDRRPQSYLAHPRPYWLSYPTLARFSGLEFVSIYPVDAEVRDKTICVITAPNNPDGATRWHDDESVDIWDAAYASPVYGVPTDWRPPVARLSVWSAAKMLGLAGLRIGWVATEDADLAALVAEYVEKTTSGVSTLAQAQLEAMLRFLQQNPKDYQEAIAGARQDLLTNGRNFLQYLGHRCRVVAGLPVNGHGMFAWFQADNDQAFLRVVAAAGVRLIPGKFCGAQEPGWYRLSLGQDPDVLAPVLASLS